MESTTHWVLQINQGNRDAAEELWRRYYRRLVTYAREQLRSRPRCSADEEDIALSAFDSFYRAAEAGRFPELNSSDNLWRLLVTIAARKAANRVRGEYRQKRAGGRIDVEASELVEEQVGREPNPAFVVEAIDLIRELLGELGDGSLLRVAIRRMEGYRNEEIAAELGCSPRTVDRKLAIVRRHFREAEADL